MADFGVSGVETSGLATTVLPANKVIIYKFKYAYKIKNC
jgi:hypothetical protein